MIQIESLTKDFGAHTAVDRVSLEVESGEIYALLGANGAGKTTALRCVAGLLRPTVGRVRIAGHDVVHERAAALGALAFLPATAGVYERLTARELLEFSGRLHGLGGPELRSRTTEAAEVFGLAGFLDRRAGTLSTGERRRVALARSLVHRPPVVVLDEPTSGLDVVAASAVYEFAKRVRDDGRAVLFSTHRMDEVALLADRVGILSAGCLEVEGRPDEVVAELGVPDLTAAFLQIVGRSR